MLKIFLFFRWLYNFMVWWWHPHPPLDRPHPGGRYVLWVPSEYGLVLFIKYYIFLSMGRHKTLPTQKQFNHWTVLGFGSQKKLLCRCVCGAEQEVLRQNLQTGISKSCGCKKAEMISSANKGVSRNKQHGQCSTALYNRWKIMRQRCNWPKHHKYPLYGGRGIKVCERWAEFKNFYEDMGDPPFPGASLDRINNDGDYEPSNVRWATAKEQRANSVRPKKYKTPKNHL